MLRATLNHEFTRFLLSGGTAALVNWFSRIIYSQWMGYSAAVVLAYLSGMLSAYILFRMFVFGSGSHSLTRSVFYYVLINALGLLLTWATSVGLAFHLFPALDFDWHPLALAHAIGVAMPVLSSYLGHKYFTFSQQG